MNKLNPIVHVFSGNQSDAFILKDILDQNGIAVVVKNEFESGLMAGFGGGITPTVDLFVKETDVKKATPIIEDFKADL